MADTVIVQKWEESEAGWGTRPDGYSLHLSEADRKEYIDAYWARMPELPPPEYERPCGSPYLADAKPETVAELETLKSEDKYGVRRYRGPYPGSGGRDGWVPHNKEKAHDGGLA